MRAFEAAARHLSFTKAAQELHVTPAAISQQVRQLEEHVGARMFHRLTRALSLTEQGRAALPLVTEGLDRLAEAATEMRRQRDSGILTVSVPPTFGAKWLLPKLERFRNAHPGIEIRVDATDRMVDFAAEQVDIAVRYGSGEYGALVSELLLCETAFPVCSPGLPSPERPLESPTDLKHHMLLHGGHEAERDRVTTWPMWLRAAGIENLDAARGMSFSVASLAIQAAIDGHGVALASGPHVADDLAAGRLIRPFAPSPWEATDFAFYLVYPSGALSDSKLARFREWALAEAKAATPAPDTADLPRIASKA